jgi:LAS superfamily LD-carboxypeptidase LdcB
MINPQQIMGLNPSHVVPLNEQHFLLPEVRDVFYEMQAAGAEAGVDFQICSSFRSFDKQLSIWNRKWRGELPLYSINGEALNAHELSDTEKLHAILTWSALPGGSRHHWGTDFDFFDRAKVEASAHQLELIPEEYEDQGPCADLASWVHEQSAAFGFYLPYAKFTGGVAREPWHLSFQTLAEQIQASFNIDALSEQLNNSDMLGKECVLSCLTELVRRYTYNKGISE